MKKFFLMLFISSVLLVSSCKEKEVVVEPTPKINVTMNKCDGCIAENSTITIGETYIVSVSATSTGSAELDSVSVHVGNAFIYGLKLVNYNERQELDGKALKFQLTKEASAGNNQILKVTVYDAESDRGFDSFSVDVE